jgi:hypothetical protein
VAQLMTIVHLGTAFPVIAFKKQRQQMALVAQITDTQLVQTPILDSKMNPDCFLHTELTLITVVVRSMAIVDLPKITVPPETVILDTAIQTKGAQVQTVNAGRFSREIKLAKGRSLEAAAPSMVIVALLLITVQLLTAIREIVIQIKNSF